MRSFPILALLVLLAPAAAAQEIAPFRSVLLENGGELVLVHGPAQRVTTLEGGRAELSVVAGRLSIGPCRTGCPGGRHRLRVEVVTPWLAEVAVANGGTIRARPGFPRQPDLAARVTSGGLIDLRALPAGRARATVSQGGIILLSAEASLDAAVEQGGRIAYWGRPSVHRRVRFSGVVERGAAADFDRPLADLGPGEPPPVPPLPPLPPAPVAPPKLSR